LLWLVCSVVAPSTLPAQESAGPPERSRRILILYSNRAELPANAILGRAIRSALDAGIDGTTEFYSEHLDVSRFPGDAHLQLQSDFLRRRYADKKLDLIIAVSPPALDFLARFGAGLVPGTPVVVGAIDERAIRGPLPPGVTAVVSSVQMRTTFELALGLHPGTRRAVIVAGASRNDRFWAGEARRELQAAAPGVEIVDLGDRSMGELLRDVASQPPRTLIFYVHVLQDGAGHLFVPQDVVARIAAVANVPIYGFYETFLGHGIVGGHVYSFEAQGAKAGEIALRILRGERAEDVPPVRHDPNVYMFDARQLKRWSLDEARLPRGSVVRYREPSAWERYRWYVVGGLAVFAVQTILIAGLLVHRAQRRRAQRALAERLRFETLLAELSATFLVLPAGEVDGGIDRGLGRVGEELGLDRVMLAEAGDEGAAAIRITHLWMRRGTGTIPSEYETDAFPWIARRLRAGETVCVPRLDALPDDAATDRQRLAGHGTRSFAVIPLAVAGSAVATLGLSTVTAEREWPAELVARLRLLGEVFANAVARKQAERALRESEVRFRRMADSAPTMVWLTGPDGRRTYVNPRWLGLTGRRLEDELGAGWLAAVHADDREPTQALVDGALAGRRAFTTEYRLRRGDGEYRWILDHGAPRSGEDGAFGGHVGSAIDVTELKAAQQVLLERDALHSAIFGSLYAQMATLDRDGGVIAVNDAWTRFAEENGGDATRAAVGVNYLEICRRAADAGDQAAHRALEAILSVRDGHTAFARFEYPSPPGDRWFEMTVEPFRRAEGGVIVSHVDVTRRRQAEEEARQQREELAHVLRVTTLGELAGSLAHEINQPLAAILTNVQAVRRMLGAGGPPGPDATEALGDIAADARRTSEIIRRLRALFRRESGERRPLDLERLAGEVVDLLRFDLQRKGITVRHAPGGDLPAVPGDAVQLQQVLLNVVVNAGDAIAAAAEGPREIAIETRCGAPGRVVLSVRDTGIGVKDADLERIFEHFVSSKPDGLGMGLAISRSIVQAHGGRIWATPNDEGRGLTVHVELPAEGLA
jgi:PAS domain S-box-containing protein